jgi:ribosomal protein L14E/L6E/L27E
MMSLICPVMSANGGLVKCMGQKCAWWSEVDDECIVVAAGAGILEEVERSRIQWERERGTEGSDGR